MYIVAKAAIAKADLELFEPPYSPDLAHSYYRLFPKIKEHLCGRFSSEKDVICYCKSMVFRC